MATLFLIVSGYGKPHDAVKRQILRHNLERITRTHTWSRIDLHVCVYDDSDVILDANADADGIVHLHIHREPGLPGTFLKRFARPEDVATYDHVLVIMDDVQLMPNVDLSKMIHLKQFFGMDIVSPTMTLDSQCVWAYMLTNANIPSNTMIVSPTCEFFCYLTDPKAWAIYYEHIDAENNPWLWGLDLILYDKIGLKVGMINNMCFKHFYHKTCYHKFPDKNPLDGYNKLITKYGLSPSEGHEKRVRPLYLVVEPSFE